jgi:Arc/MetJ-type ribon-helix-helix transcriptional regulator
VQLGKTVANQIENAIKNNNFENIDESTKAAIKFLFNR